MNGARIRAIVDKEIADARKNKMIVISMAIVPILLVAMVWGTAFFMLKADAAALDENDLSIIPPALRDMNPQHAFLMIMNDQYLFYFLLIPMVMPVYIAAYSIVGEKETKSLEPLLATPISVEELLVGKSLAAVVPSVILTWLSFAVLVAGSYFLMPAPVFGAMVRPVWMVGMVLLSPLLALLSVLCGVVASSRMNDPRAAQGVVGIFVVPLIALSMGVLMGKIFLNVGMVFLASLVVLALDGVVLYFAVKLFQRETILTHWK
jgi:ABC-2 type transport system permease protein